MTLRPILLNSWSIRIYIFCIALISVFGAYYLNGQINIIKKDLPGIITAKRNAAAEALRVLNTLKDDVVHPDFSLYVKEYPTRAQIMIERKIIQAVETISASSLKLELLHKKFPNERSLTLSKDLRSLVVSGARALDVRGSERTERAIEFFEMVTSTFEPLSLYIKEQSKVQLEASEEQRSRLEDTTMAAAALLGFFAVFSTATGMLLRAELVSQEKRSAAEKSALFHIYHDPLTRLPNRTRFNDLASRFTTQPNTPFLFLVDVDEFKAVNDSFGHGAGDSYLVELARRIDSFAKNRSGIAARLGGDEFAAIIPDGPHGLNADALCLELKAVIARPLNTTEFSLTPRVSIGAVHGKPRVANSLSDLLTSADLALHEAKDHGKDQFVVYREALAEKANRRREIKNAVPDALKNEEFEVHFQPQIHLETGILQGFEALVRWRRDGRLVPPGEFIPILEETGLVRNVDLWVLRKAAMTAAQWLKIRQRPTTISANLSPLHFQFDDIVSEVASVLHDSSLPPHLLTLEITESVLLENFEHVTSIMKQLSDLGVSMSLDDFGTGYSSLAYLRNLKVNELKIDRAFVTDLETSNQTEIVLTSIVEIAKGLSMSTVVEGIETLKQRDIVRSIGAHTGQGFLFGRPLEEAKVLEIIRNEADNEVDWNQKADTEPSSVSFQVA